MRTLLRGLGALLLLAIAGGAFVFCTLDLPAPMPIPDPGVTLRGVTVVNPGQGRLEGRDLVVEGDRILSIEATAGADDGFAGAFVLPGLADAHIHFPPTALPGQTELFAFLFLYHGVTLVRDAGDLDGTATAPAREGVASERFPGPRILACGPFVDGPGALWGNSIVVEDAEQARSAARAVAGAGFDCVKAYNELSAEASHALREEAQRIGLEIIGHVSRNLSYEEARLDDVQHLIGVASPLDDKTIEYPQVMRAWQQTDDARLAHIANFSRQHGITNTPTLVTNDRRAAASDYDASRAEPDAQLLPRFYRDVIWSPTEGTLRGVTPEDFELLRAARGPMLRAVKTLYDAGAPLRTGTDVLNPFIVPGAGLHRELELFVRAGLSPEQALAVSRDTATTLGGGRTGWLEAGAPADLLVFREDPTRDLAALDTLEAVVAAGRLYRREDLDRQLAAYRAAFDSAAYDAITVPLVRRALADTVGE